MTAGDDDAQPFRRRHQRMIDRLGPYIDGKQERIENWIVEPDAHLILLELQKAHIEGGIPGNENTVAHEILELGKHDARWRLVPCHVFGDAVNAHARRWIERPGLIRRSKVSLVRICPLTMRTAPIAMSSSPSDGLIPVVSVSNTT